MRISGILLLVLAGCSPGILSAQANKAGPVIRSDVHAPGPQRIGNLPPVVFPPDNPPSAAKTWLGKQLYFDTRLSADNTVSCASCHSPAMGWSDAGPTSKGIRGQLGGRRSPPVSNAAYNPLQFWDGRSPSLEDQAKGPIANPVEMGSTHEVMIRTVDNIPGYAQQFRSVFGTTQITVDHVAKAIADFERTVVTTDSPFDRYVRGDSRALTPLEQRGLEVFNGKGHCTSCHWGGNLSDGRFHNIGVRQAPGTLDLGRYEVTGKAGDRKAFKTPTMRDVGLRPPYLHNGSEKTLEEVIDFYDRGGDTSDPNRDPLIVPLGLSGQEKKALAAFMRRAMTSLNPEVADVAPVPPEALPK